MKSRKGLVFAAACAAVALTGVARAEEASIASPGQRVQSATGPSALTLTPTVAKASRPLYLQASDLGPTTSTTAAPAGTGTTPPATAAPGATGEVTTAPPAGSGAAPENTSPAPAGPGQSNQGSASPPATGPASSTPPPVIAPTSLPVSSPWNSTTPLMTLLADTPVGKTLSDLNVTFSGHLEGSYTYQNQGHPPGNIITGRLFDLDNEQPEMNQAMIAVDRTLDYSKPQFDVGAHFEIMYGTDSRFVHALGEWDTQHTQYQWDVTQAYLTLAIPVGNKAMGITAGKFVTLAGYEVIDPTGNQLYSHSFLFDYAIPFTQTGAYASYQITDAVQINLGSSRGWDTSLRSYNDNWDGFGSVVYQINDNTKLTVDAIVGKDEPVRNSKWRELIDVILQTKVNDRTILGFNGDYAHEDRSAAIGGRTSAQWFGAAGYAQVGLDRPLADRPLFALNARVEYFNDDKGVRVAGAIGTGVELFEGTLGVAITPFRDNPVLSTLVFRPEIRIDYANKSFFNAGSSRYQYTAAIDAVYKF